MDSTQVPQAAFLKTGCCGMCMVPHTGSLSCLAWAWDEPSSRVDQIFVLLWFLLISLRLRLFSPDIRRARPCLLQPAAWNNQWMLMRRLPGNIHYTQLPCRHHMCLTGTERTETEAYFLWAPALSLALFSQIKSALRVPETASSLQTQPPQPGSGPSNWEMRWSISLHLPGVLLTGSARQEACPICALSQRE